MKLPIFFLFSLLSQGGVSLAKEANSLHPNKAEGSHSVRSAASGASSIQGFVHDKSRRLQNETLPQLGCDILGPATGSNLGVAVALSADGSTLVSGAEFAFSGLAQVHQWTDGAWRKLGDDLIGDDGEGEFGATVAISDDGTVVACGAPRFFNDSPGQTHVYEWDGIAWSQRGQTLSGDGEFGSKVALSGDASILAVGSPLYFGVAGLFSGRVQVFEWADGTWTERGTGIEGEEQDDTTSEVALSQDGSIVAISSKNNDGPTGGFANGLVRVFQWNSGSWDQIGSSIVGDEREAAFGAAIDISDDGTIVAKALRVRMLVRIMWDVSESMNSLLVNGSKRAMILMEKRRKTFSVPRFLCPEMDRR